MTIELALSLFGLLLCLYGIWLHWEMKQAQIYPIAHISFKAPKQDHWTLEQAIQHVKARDARLRRQRSLMAKFRRRDKGRFA